MILRNILLGVLICAEAIVGTATETVCRPGELKTILGSEAATVSELTLVGTVDASDLFYIGSSMPMLRNLDMSQCSIAEYNGDMQGNSNTWPAGMIPDCVFAGAPITGVVLPQNDELVIGEGAFAGSALKTISLSANITRLGMGAFVSCPDLESAKLASGVKLESYTFHMCPRLSSVDLDGITALSESDFAECTSLSTVIGAESLTGIAPYSFAGCTSLTEFPFSLSLNKIGSRAFYDSGLTDVSISSPLKVIEAWAFAECDDLTNVALPESVTSIGQGAFSGCSSLTEFVLPSGCSVMADYLLNGTVSLDSINISSNTLAQIGDYAMKGAGVSDVALPATLTRLGTGAMEGTTSLTGIDGKRLKAVPSLGNDVWAGVDQSAVQLHVMENLKDDFDAAPQWQDFTIIPTPTGVETVITESVSITCTFDANVLELRSSGCDFARVVVYDLGGKQIADVRPGSDLCSIAADHIESKILIVRCEFADGSAAVIKPAR